MKKVHLLYLLIFFTFVGCKKDLETINTNQNAPTEVHPSLLLRNIIYNTGEEMSYEGFVAGNLLAQYGTQVDFNLFDRHSLTETQYGGDPWSVLYKNLRDNEILLNKANESKTNKIYAGPALILKAYLAAALTDIYGNVPYSEALKGTDGITQPKYDEQKDIYMAPNGILDNLDKAIELLSSYQGTTIIEGDILYNGNKTSWIKFANSLKIKYLMRISDREPISSKIQAVYDQNMYFTTNQENATFPFTDGLPNNFRMASLRDGDFNLFVMSKTAEQLFADLDDPRVHLFYRPKEDTTGGLFAGLQNGPDASQTSISIANYSKFGTAFREQTSLLSANFMTAWETAFLLAEAAEKGLLAANAKTLYESGVIMAFEYWHTPLPNDYLTNTNAYGVNGANPIEQILTQKWISNTVNGYESWIEYRRTGHPKLLPVQASLNGGKFPVRMPYPSQEQALNSTHYFEQNNDINHRVWWDLY